MVIESEPRFMDMAVTYLERLQRPPHIGIPRKLMDSQFAVQLMRSSYNIADELDFVPMDEFQKSFFLFRQSEWEDYKSHHNVVVQGNLADPIYFDFISFCQYAVISNKMKTGQIQFVEKVGAEGESQIVRRNPTFELNSMLPNFFSLMVGERLLNFIQDKYSTITATEEVNSYIISIEDANNNKPRRVATPSTFGRIAQLLLDVFIINSYAISADIQELPSTSMDGSTMLKITLRAPANLWSSQVLAKRGDRPINYFEIFILQCLANRLGLECSLISSYVSNQIDLVHTIKLI